MIESSKTAINICLIFRKKRAGFYSIETLFDSLIKYLSDNFVVKKLFLPYELSVGGFLKNILFVRKLKSCDVCHITGDVHYVLPFCRGKKVLTIHDLRNIFEYRGIKRWLYKFLWFKLPIYYADKITVISEFTFGELKKQFKFINSTQIIPDCVDDEWFLERRPEERMFFNRILFIGTKPNKNLDRVIKAVEGLRVKLIIIGRLFDYQKNALKNAGADYENFYDLSKEQVREQYLRSDVLLFPSLYEGFGLPIIEAQALGVPVITSNKPPMNQIAGKAALFIDPMNVDSIHKAIVEIMSNIALRNRLIMQGYINARKYKCSQVAQLYEKVYYEVLGLKKCK